MKLRRARPAKLVRELRLKRRRWRVPWIYVVYHRHETELGRAGAARIIAPWAEGRRQEL
jgi:hypothetical protein